MIRILLIPSSDYLGHPFPQRHNHLFERLHEHKDFEVHIIRFNIFGKPKLDSKCIIHEIPFEIRTKSTALYYPLNMLSYTNRILKIVKQESIDIVIAGNLLPPLTYMIIQQLQERRIPLIFDLQDYYPAAAAGYIANVNSFLGITSKGLFELMIKYLVRVANVVTVPGMALAMYVKKMRARHVYLVPNGISENFLQRYDGKEIRKKLNIELTDIVIGYIGSIEFWLDMKSLIRGIALIKQKGVDIKFLLIGNYLQTGYPKKVKNWLKMYGVERYTIWLNFIPHEEVPKYIAAMNIGTIPFDTTNPTAYYAAPNKLWEYLSQGILVLTTPIPEVLMYKDFVTIVKTEMDIANAIYKYTITKPCRYSLYKKILPELMNRLWTKSATKLGRIIRKVVQKKDY